jgi:hypothetical protein
MIETLFGFWISAGSSRDKSFGTNYWANCYPLLFLRLRWYTLKSKQVLRSTILSSTIVSFFFDNSRIGVFRGYFSTCHWSK